MGRAWVCRTELPLPTLSREDYSCDSSVARQPLLLRPVKPSRRNGSCRISRLTHAAESANDTRIRKDIELGLLERQLPRGLVVIVENRGARSRASRHATLPACSSINCVAILAELDGYT